MPTIISIDKAGRIVLAKAIRERMHIDEWCRLELKIVGGTIEMTPANPELEIEERNGLPVIVGWDGFDAARALSESRQDHLSQLGCENKQ